VKKKPLIDAQALVRCDPEPLHILVPGKHPAVKTSAKDKK
jgi:hypothetical protein